MQRALAPWLRNTVVASLLITQYGLADTPASGEPAAAPNSDTGTTSGSPPSKEQCIESHRQSQQAQNEGKLVHARELARTCTSLACPGLLISDCARWLNDLDQRIPSVVFEVRLDGSPNRNANVFADGSPVNEWTRGEALRLDPGDHQFRFELPGFEPIVQNLLLAEGMRYRIASAEFKSPVASKEPTPLTATPAPVSEPPAPVRERPTPFIVYPLLAAAGVGTAGFVTFALLGKSSQSDLEKTCSPNCEDSDLSPMKRNYLIGDIALGVGAASLIAAGVFYFTRPEKEVPQTSVGMAPLPGGAAGFASYRF